MISFIIIGKNEGLKLVWCFNSIKKFIAKSKLKCEIIYVDSKSSDGSYETALNDPEIKTFRLKGKCNAAIGRNFGAKMAQGDVFCFFDGDMELLPDKLECFLSKQGNLIYPIINPNRIDYFYDSEGNYLGNNENLKVGLKDKYDLATGGLILIEKDLWESVNGMDESLRCMEDIDLAYRVYTKKKIKVLNSKVILVKHHTTRYTDSKRYYSLVFSDYFFYRGKLYRKHFLSPTIILRMLSDDLSLVALVVSVIMAILFKNVAFIFIYFLVSAVKLLFVKRIHGNVSLFKRYFMDIIKDCNVVIGFFIKK